MLLFDIMTNIFIVKTHLMTEFDTGLKTKVHSYFKSIMQK